MDRAEAAKTLVCTRNSGFLATRSQAAPGFPFASAMPYAVDGRGSPVFFVSSIAVHTQNMRKHQEVSLLITERTDGDALSSSRVTLLGCVSAVPSEQVSSFYLAQHQNARQWQDFSDFSYMRLQIESVYFIGGFGVMGWITADEYYRACPTT